MPLYDYACRACDERFEEFVHNSASAVACPGCGSHEADRLLSRFSATVPAPPATDYRRLAHHAGSGGGCGGGCGHAH